MVSGEVFLVFVVQASSFLSALLRDTHPWFFLLLSNDTVVELLGLAVSTWSSLGPSMDSIDRWDDELLSMRLNSILSMLDSLLDVSSNLSNRFLLALLMHPFLKLLVQLLIGSVSPGNIYCFVVVIS